MCFYRKGLSSADSLVQTAIGRNQDKLARTGRLTHQPKTLYRSRQACFLLLLAVRAPSSLIGAACLW